MADADAVPLVDHAGPAIERALAQGELTAADHPCPACAPCPECVPIHAEMSRLGAARAMLGREAPGLSRQIADQGAQHLLRYQQRNAELQGKAIVAHGQWRAAQALANALGAAVPGVPSVDATRFSLVPREGWTVIDLGENARMWVADPADVEEARQLASQVASAHAAQAAYQQAVDDAFAAQQASERAGAASRAARAELDAAIARVRSYAENQLRMIGDSLAAWEQMYDWLEARFAQCLADCRSGGDAGAGGPGGVLQGVLGGLAIVAGAGMVMFGQPFDSGTESVDAQPFVGDALSVFEFDLTAVDPLHRTSFFAEPLADLGLFPGELGDPINLTHIGLSSLRFDEPLIDPVATMFDGVTFGPTDVVFEPEGSTGVAEDGVVLIELEFDANLLSPDFCDGRMIQFATSINNPAIAGLYTDVGPFVGDYGQGANTILRQELTDCGSAANAIDFLGESFSFDGASPVGGWLTGGDDGSRHLAVLPWSVLPGDASFRSVFFEVESGAPFEFDNTRYQSTPDDLAEMIDASGIGVADLATQPTTPVEGDADETDPTLVGLGLLSGAAGATAVAGSNGSPTGRRRDDDDDSGITDGAAPMSNLPDGETSRAADSDGREEMLEAALDLVRRYDRSHAEFAADRAETAAEHTAGLFAWFTGPSAAQERELSQVTSFEAHALSAYRTAVAEYLAAGLLTVSASERGSALDALAAALPQADTVQAEETERVRSVIELDAGDAQRQSVLAGAEARLETANIAAEAVALARTRINPAGVTGAQPALVEALDRLEQRIESSARDRVHRAGQSEAAYQASAWFRDTRRSQAMDSVIVLSENGTLVDPGGSVVDGSMRRQFVADRLAAVSEDLDASAWRGHDTRSDDAARLRHRLREVYSALDFLGHGDVDTQEYFRGVTAAIRERQTEVNHWFVSEFLNLPVDDGGSWWDTIEVGWSVRLGTSGRTHGFGENSIEVVRDRIHRMNLEADRAVDLLTDAASSTVEELDPSTRDALTDLGYITTDASGRSSYRIPTVDTAAARVTRLDRPGASWLDVVSVQNAGEILVSVAIPELAAVRASAIAARLGLSGRAIVAAKAVTDQGVGLALDVGFASIHGTGEASLARVAAESLATSWAGVLANRGTDEGLRRAFSSGPITALLSDPNRRATALGWTSTMLGVGNETLISIAATAAAQSDVSSEDVLAALLSTAMNRAVGSLGRSGADAVESGLARLPRDLREASVVLAPTLQQARDIDARLDASAGRRFDAVTGDRPLDRATGTEVWEALRLGALSWSELQRVYTQRGRALDSVMDQVRIERDRFVQSVVVRARAAAITMINDHFDSRIAATQDPAERTRLDTARRAEFDKIDPVGGHRPGASSRYGQLAIEVMSSGRSELLERFGSKIGEPGDRSLAELREAALATVMTDVIQPGSAGATSDIDRSWSSEWLRRAAQTVVEAEMMRGRIDDGPPPTTATAFDTNEYVNVMTRIKAIITQRGRYEGLPAVTVTVVGDGAREVTLTHAEAAEANSLAAAMLHMRPGQRTRFEANVIGGSDPDRRATVEAMFAHALTELAASEDALRLYTDAEAERMGTSVDDPDTRLRARDRLYGDRMEALDALGTRIDALPVDSPERAELMSQYELSMNRALRDGIETYSDMANLDIIVTRMQSADGRKRTPTELMRSTDFSIRDGGELAHLSEAQIRSMFNDQVLMIMHHVSAYRTGYESPAKATRSLAKYAERALLALNLIDGFHPDTAGPHSALFEATRRLMLHKDDPVTLLRVLVDAAPPGTGSVAGALHWYLGQIETLPGLDGLTRGPAFVVDSAGHTSSLAMREWLRRSDADVASMIDDHLATTGDLARLDALQEFAPHDRHNAETLLETVENLNLRQRWLAAESGEHQGAYRQSLRVGVAEALDALADLRRRGAAFEGVDPDADLIEALRARVDAQQRLLTGN